MDGQPGSSGSGGGTSKEPTETESRESLMASLEALYRGAMATTSGTTTTTAPTTPTPTSHTSHTSHPPTSPIKAHFQFQLPSDSASDSDLGHSSADLAVSAAGSSRTLAGGHSLHSSDYYSSYSMTTTATDQDLEMVDHLLHFPPLAYEMHGAVPIAGQVTLSPDSAGGSSLPGTGTSAGPSFSGINERSMGLPQFSIPFSSSSSSSAARTFGEALQRKGMAAPEGDGQKTPTGNSNTVSSAGLSSVNNNSQAAGIGHGHTSSERERELEMEIERLKAQMAAKDRAAEKRDKMANAMPVVQGVVELTEDGNSVTLIECTNPHLIGMFPSNFATLSPSDSSAPHPKLSPGVYEPQPAAASSSSSSSSAPVPRPRPSPGVQLVPRSPQPSSSVTALPSPYTTYGIASAAHTHPLRQSIVASSGSIASSAPSNDLTNPARPSAADEEPMDYFSASHRAGSNGTSSQVTDPEFTPTAKNMVTHRTLTRDSTEGSEHSSVFDGPVPMDGGDPTFVNFNFPATKVLGTPPINLPSSTPSSENNNNNNRKPPLHLSFNMGSLPSSLQNSFLTYLHMLRAVQFPREDSPFIVDATTPGTPGASLSPLDKPSSIYRKRTGSSMTGIESARNMIKSWRFDWTPHPSPVTPGSISSLKHDEKTWGVSCFPLSLDNTEHVNNVDGKGRVTRAGFVMYDVSGYKREVRIVEEKARAREREVRQKVDFLSTISHEVRTPLHGLLGFAALLDVSPGLSQDQRDLLKAIRDCSESLHSIVSEFLDWAKLDAGKAELEYSPFELREVVGSLGMIWKMQGSRKGLGRVTVEVEDTVPQRVLGDVERIKQVLNNMLSNAVKFTPPGGSVELKVACSGVPIAARAPSTAYSRGSGSMSIGSNGNNSLPGSNGTPASQNGSGNLQAGAPTYSVMFSVRDSGIGISAAGKAKLFQNFQQADTTISRRFGGTGLGLAISRGLVELMGGKMDVESSDEPGKSYSKFWIEIPLVAVPDPAGGSQEKGAQAARSPSGQLLAATAALAPDSRRSGFAMNANAIASVEQQGELADQAPLKLMVAEDNPLNQKLILRLLAKLGYRDTVIAADGKECVDKAHDALREGKPYDLIFMDLFMPNVTGLEATEMLRSSAELSEAKRQPFIVAMSASVLQEDQDRCYQVGMNGFLAKPLRVPDLITTLKRFWADTQERHAAELSN